MKQCLVSFIFGVSVLFLSGCILLPIPHEHWFSPRFYGTVVDAESGQPLEGVKITLNNYHFGEEKLGPIVVYSDASGHYSVLASEHWSWFVILAGGDAYHSGAVTFEREGYDTFGIKKGRFGGAGEARDQFEVNVRLKKQQANVELEPIQAADNSAIGGQH